LISNVLTLDSLNYKGPKLIFFIGWIEYLLYTELTYTLIGTGLNSSSVFPSKISQVRSVVLFSVFNLSSLFELNLHIIYFSSPGVNTLSLGSMDKHSLNIFFFIVNLN